MIQKTLQFIYDKATGRNILILFLLSIVNMLIFLAGYQYATGQLNNGIEFIALDNPLSSVEEVYQRIKTYNAAARQTHVWLTLTADFTFPIIYSLLFSLTIVFYTKKTLSKYLIISVIPFLGAFFDYLEAIGIVGLLINYNQQMSGFATFFLIVKFLKFVFFYISIFIILGLFITWIIKKSKNK